MANETENGSWQLAYVFGAKEEGDEEPTTQIQAIEGESAESLAQDAEFLSDYHRTKQLIEAVQFNLQQYHAAVSESIREHATAEGLGEDRLSQSLKNIPYLVLNILGSFRAFLDHSDYALPKVFGENSSEVAEWELRQSEVYDSYFAYRFMYKFRNYCQHVGMPPIQFSFSQSEQHEGEKFEMSLMKSTLLEERSVWNQKIVADLENAPERIAFAELLELWSESFRKLSEFLLKIKSKRAHAAAHNIATVRERHNLPSGVGYLCRAWIPFAPSDSGILSVKMHWLPEELASEVLSNVAAHA